jgi:Holliday junction resolvase RusA-like endonuclease
MAALVFTVRGNPLSQNRAFRVARTGRSSRAPRRMILSDDARTFKALVAEAAARAVHRAWRRDVEVDVEFRLYFDSRRPDADGPVKLALDALQGVKLEPKSRLRVGGCIANDRQVRDYAVRKRLDRENPRLEVRVSVVDPNSIDTVWPEVAS